MLSEGDKKRVKTLVVGQGHLGTILAEALPARLWPARMKDIGSEDIPPGGTVICAAGKTDLRWCEDHPREAWGDNVEEPLRLAQVALRAGASFIHLSSACLWEGPYQTDGRPFGPDTPPNPPSWYGWTKAACDAFLLDLHPTWDKPWHRIAILRPRQPFSPVNHPRNTLTKLCQYEGLIDTPNSMTSTRTIVATVRRLLDNTHHRLWNRISLVYDQGVTTPLRVGMMLYEAGRRSAPPKRLDKGDLDSWHKPKRVDVVCYDPVFESTGLAGILDERLAEAIAGLSV